MSPRPQSSAAVRQAFFDFFEEKGHTLVPSAPLVPHDDPTLLFINAGMNQFKDVFLETGSRPYDRAVNSQKCLRVSGKHNDLEEVGHDTYHHTFFEMLGNWSFGDYFKKEAIAWAWELLVGRWGLDPARLYATVHEGDERLGLDADDEAARHWKDTTSIPEDNILYGSSDDNFWMMGDTGPCGPCSELHVDLRTDEERAATPGEDLVNADDPRVIEIWNLVFIQYIALPDGSLEPLPRKHVDTGMGFERLCAVLQGKASTYDTDIFAPLFNHLQTMRGNDTPAYAEASEKEQIAMRVVVDHLRTIAFATADGAAPSNVGRGYVVRRILRRAVRYGYQDLGFREPFLWKLVEPLAESMGEAFPEIPDRREMLERTIKGEEEGFLRTLGAGIAMLDGVFGEMDEGGVVSGDDAFLLHDTYGFPIDLTALMAHEKGLDVDHVRFDELMEEQRSRARAAGTFEVDQSRIGAWQELTDGDHSRFLGYDHLEVDPVVVRRHRQTADEAGRHEIVLDRTPFYAEAGGQVGDTGTLDFGGEVVHVVDTRRLDDGTIVHLTESLPSDPSLPAVASVDADRRRRTMRHHTATHLLHAALREILGEHVQQKGSLVAPDRLRFDFSHFEKVSPEQQARIEERVNELVLRNTPVEAEPDVPLAEARKRGAMALFGEKYGETVRVITIDPDISIELCGGTHVGAAGEVGLFRIVSEGSVASGIRRIEAVAGEAALEHASTERRTLREVESLFKNIQQPIAEVVGSLIEEQRSLQKEVSELKTRAAAASLQSLVDNPTPVGDARLVTADIGPASMDTLRELAADLRERLGPDGVAVLGATDPEGEKVYLAATVGDDLIKRGLQAGKLVGTLARIVGGGGGGRPQLATAGGKQPERLGEALDAAEGEVTKTAE